MKEGLEDMTMLGRGALETGDKCCDAKATT